MVAGQYGKWFRNTVENLFYIEELFVRALVGDVAVHHHVVKFSVVYFFNCETQLAVVFVAGYYMQVAEHCYALCAGSESEGRAAKGYYKRLFHGMVLKNTAARTP